MFVTAVTQFQLLSLVLALLVGTQAASIDIQKAPATIIKSSEIDAEIIQSNEISAEIPTPEYLISRADIDQVLSK